MSDLPTPHLAAFNLLCTIVGDGHRATDHAPMTSGPEEYRDKRKYYTVHEPITDKQLHAHLLGEATYAVLLIGTDGLVSAGLIELDRDHLEGAKRVQRAAANRNVTIVSIATHGAGDHDGSHNWAIFEERVNPAHARALMKQIAADAGYPDAETWPTGDNIRLPFGRHRWTGDWGITLLPTGEIFDNNNPDERAAAAAATAALPLNGVPPEPPRIERPSSIGEFCPRVKTGTAGRASLPDVRARFNAEHTWSELLTSKGGTEMRDGWACNCGYKHSHTVQIAITSRDKIVSFSPNCTWAPHKNSGKALDKFGFYVDQWHNGDVVAALKTLNPIPPRRKRHDEPPLIEAEIHVRTSEQIADAARKREARRREAADTIADVRVRAAQDATLTRCDCAVLEALLKHAGDRSWCRPSQKRIAELSGYSLGSVKRSLMRLEARGYFVSEGDGGGPNQTAIRTFLRGSSFESDALSHVTNDPRIIRTCDLKFAMGACEAGGMIQPAYLERLSIACYVRNLAAEVGGMPLEPVELAADLTMLELEQLAAAFEAELSSEVLATVVNLSDPPALTSSPTPFDTGGILIEVGGDREEGGTQDSSVAPAILANWRAVGFDDSDQPEIAVYDPTGANLVSPSVVEQAPVIIELDPLVQAPPLPHEPTYYEFIWRHYAAKPGSINKRSGRPYTQAQRNRFRGEYERYLVDVSPEEAVLRWDELKRRRPYSERAGTGVGAAHKLPHMKGGQHARKTDRAVLAAAGEPADRSDGAGRADEPVSLAGAGRGRSESDMRGAVRFASAVPDSTGIKRASAEASPPGKETPMSDLKTLQTSILDISPLIPTRMLGPGYSACLACRRAQYEENMCFEGLGPYCNECWARISPLEAAYERYQRDLREWRERQRGIQYLRAVGTNVYADEPPPKPPVELVEALRPTSPSLLERAYIC